MVVLFNKNQEEKNGKKQSATECFNIIIYFNNNINN